MQHEAFALPHHQTWNRSPLTVGGWLAAWGSSSYHEITLQGKPVSSSAKENAARDHVCLRRLEKLQQVAIIAAVLLSTLGLSNVATSAETIVLQPGSEGKDTFWGTYFYQLVAGDLRESRKMVILK